MIPGNQYLPATALQGARLVPFVIQKVLQRYEQERAETAFGWRDASQSAVSQQMRKECLGQVLRFVNRVAAPANIPVKRRPINPAELYQGLVRSLARFQHDAPMGCSKSSGLTRGGLGLVGRRAHRFCNECSVPMLNSCQVRAPIADEFHRISTKTGRMPPMILGAVTRANWPPGCASPRRA